MSRRPTGRNLPDLNRDYLEVWARLEQAVRAGSCDDVSLLDRLRVYRRFMERQGHRIGPYPHALLPIAHAEPLDSLVRADGGGAGGVRERSRAALAPSSPSAAHRPQSGPGADTRRPHRRGELGGAER